MVLDLVLRSSEETEENRGVTNDMFNTQAKTTIKKGNGIRAARRFKANDKEEKDLHESGDSK